MAAVIQLQLYDQHDCTTADNDNNIKQEINKENKNKRLVKQSRLYLKAVL